MPSTPRPTRAPRPTQVSQRRAPMERRPTDATTWAAWVFSGTGSTAAFCRPVGVAMSSRAAASSAEPGVVVDVGDGDLGEALAQPAHELGRGEAAAAEVEEVVVGPGRRAAEDGGPVARDPGRGALDAGRLLGCRRAGPGGRRPGQGVAVDLAGGAGGQGVDHGQPRDERGRHRPAQPLDRGLGVEARLGGDVADQQAVAGLAAAHRGRRAAHPGEREEGAVDLAELDAPAADLDLVVGPAVEHQALAVEPDDVAAAVGAVPAQGGHRGVHLRVLGRVEVAGQPDAADDQLARLAVGHAVALRVDDGEVPAVERQPDAHRWLAGEPGAAGDDGGLGGAVGVPDLAARGGQAGADLGRAGLAAEDEQAHVVERRRRPERDQGGHGGDDGDVVGAQPRAEVHARLHERARGRDEAGAVAPGQPHLLAARVEGHAQPGHDPVARADRSVLQEHPRLGVDEGGRAAVADRDPLGRAGGAGGEDDPGVVGEVGVLLGRGLGGILGRQDDQVGGDHRGHPGLVEHQARPLVGVVVVDRHVGRTGEQDADDGDVEVGGAAGDAHAHPVAAAHALVAQGGGDVTRRREQLVVGEHLAAVVDGRGVGVVVGRGPQHVDEGARGRGVVGAQQWVGARPGGLHGAHGGGPVVRGSGRPAQQATAPGVDEPDEDDADEDDHLDE